MSTHAVWQQSIITFSRTFTALIILLALYWGRTVFIPIALAVLLTILLNPIVRALQRLGFGRTIAVMLVVSCSGVALGVIGTVGSRQVTMMISQLPENTAKITAKLRSLKAMASGPTAKRFEEMIEAIGRELPLKSNSHSPPSPDNTSNSTSQSIETIVLDEPFPWMKFTGPLASALELIATLAFAMVLVVFFLMEREGLRDRIVLLAGRSHLTLTSKALEDATTRVSRYIVMVELVNGSFGLLLAIGLFLIGLPYAILWGCVAALCRFVPYLGPWIGALFPITMSLALSEGWWQPITVFVFVLTLELITNNAIEPILFGHTTGVAPTALLISAALWLFIWGPVGLILSAPFAVSLVVIGKNIPQFEFLSILLGDQPALSSDAGFYQRLLVQDTQEAALHVSRRAQEPDPDRVYDELMVPALSYLKRDVKKGHLSDEEAESVLQALKVSFSNVTSAEPAEIQGEVQDLTSLRQLKVLCCGADGKADRAAASVLTNLLDHRRWTVDVVPADTLTSELVELIAAESPCVICIISLPPAGSTRARYLCKKLRAAGIDLPIVVGRWGQHYVDSIDQDRLNDAGANSVVTSILETRQFLESRYPVMCHSAVA